LENFEHFFLWLEDAPSQMEGPLSQNFDFFMIFFRVRPKAIFDAKYVFLTQLRHIMVFLGRFVENKIFRFFVKIDVYKP